MAKDQPQGRLAASGVGMLDVSTRSSASRQSPASLDYDAIVIGAGIAGLYQLYRFRELGLRVRLFEAGTGVGGAWYWNRYPGARFDSESYSYAYSFSQEVLDEWSWSEHFASQPEIERYLNYVADKFDLKRDISFESLITAAHFREDMESWEVQVENGAKFTTRFISACVGPLTVPTYPRLEGLKEFKGASYHTSRWPKQPVDFKGKRVAVIGTGATGVQTIQEVAKTAGHLTVFQRTPNYALPLNNSKIKDEDQEALKASYPDIFARCGQTFGWFLHTPDPRRTLDVPPHEREAFFEAKYKERGLGIWQGNFIDILTDQKANDEITAFVRRKIRERVNDPAIAEKLVPKNHGFGTRRVPLETHYYEVYNQPNVLLVDLQATPIERITPTGIKTTDAEYPFDIIIYATGFDAITGSFDRIDIRGLNRLKLKEKWAAGPSTFLGLHTAGFPNLFMPGGPLSALGNIPRALEYNVDWVTKLVKYMEERGFSLVDVKETAEVRFTEHAAEVASRLLTSSVDSWFTGVNTNIDGKESRVVVQYRGGAPGYRKMCDASIANGYPEFDFA
jgi:cation diffusion facilitator CzcD-associated flavoprotein CzcO